MVLDRGIFEGGSSQIEGFFKSRGLQIEGFFKIEGLKSRGFQESRVSDREFFATIFGEMTDAGLMQKKSRVEGCFRVWAEN